MKKLYEGNLRKNFFIFGFPLVLTALFSQSFNIVNTFIAGSLIGDEAISATGSTAPLISFISSIFWGYGNGFSIYVAMLYGNGDYKKMSNVIKVNLTLSSVFAVIITILCLIFEANIYDFLKIEDSLRVETSAYFTTYISGLFLCNLNWSLMYTSNSMGLTVLPLAASIIVNVVNIGGSYILVKFAGMGVRGIAVATVAANFCTVLLYVISLTNALRRLGVSIKGLYFDKAEMSESWRFAFPTMLQQSAMYLCTALVSPIVNKCGPDAIAGYTVGMKLYDIDSGVYQNSNKSITTYIAQCMGAKKYKMLKKGIRTGIVQSMLILAPFLLATVFGGKIIPRFFLDSPEARHYAEVFLIWCMPFILFNVFNNLFHAIFRSTGAGQYLVISTVIYALARFGFSYLLYGKFDMYGVYAAVVLSWITEAIFGAFIYFSGKWKTPELRSKNAL